MTPTIEVEFDNGMYTCSYGGKVITAQSTLEKALIKFAKWAKGHNL